MYLVGCCDRRQPRHRPGHGIAAGHTGGNNCVQKNAFPIQARGVVEETVLVGSTGFVVQSDLSQNA